MKNNFILILYKYTLFYADLTIVSDKIYSLTVENFVEFSWWSMKKKARDNANLESNNRFEI